MDSSDIYTAEKYYSRFKTVHDSLKKDCGIQFGAIIETGQELGGGKDNGVTNKIGQDTH